MTIKTLIKIKKEIFKLAILFFLLKIKINNKAAIKIMTKIKLFNLKMNNNKKMI